MGKKDKKKMKDEAHVIPEDVCGCQADESCCCGGHEHHHSCCSEEEGFERQFYTREEKIQILEEYLADLQAEQKGVEEALKDLRKTG